MQRSEPGIPENSWFAFLLATAVALLWLAPLGSSFWLDETGTYWVVKDGLAAALSRSVSWPGQSPLYSLIAWAALAIGGPHEAALRLPSIVFMAAAALLLYRLTARVFDRETAPIACLVFVCSEPVAFAAGDARPYALGVCAVLAAALMLVRWLDTGRARFAIGYAAASAVVVHANYLFATPLIVLALYALSRVRSEDRARRALRLRVLIGAWIAAALLAAPAMAKLLDMYRARAVHASADIPVFADLLAALAPSALVGSIALGFLAAWAFQVGQTSRSAADVHVGLPPLTSAPEAGVGGSACPEGPHWRSAPLTQSLALAAGWALAPPLFCYIVSVKTAVGLFVPRYYMTSAPALAMLAGYLIRSHASVASRRLIATAVFFGAILSFGTLHHGEEDWRGAMSAIRATAGADMPVLAAAGFVEAADPKALDDPNLRETLFAPQTLYPAGGEFVRLPFRLDSKTQPYTEAALAAALAHRDRFIFVGRWQGLTFEPWLRGRLAARGFRSQSLGNFGRVGAYLFTTDAPR